MTDRAHANGLPGGSGQAAGGSEGNLMTDADKTAAPARPKPDLGHLLDCLARLDGKARVIVDRRGTVRASSTNTLSMTGDDDMRIGKPLCLEAGTRAPLGTIARLLAVRGDDTEIAILEVAPGCQPVVVRAAAIDQDLVCLVLSVPGRNGGPRMEELQTLFGLTASEARIVMDLMEGCAPQTIARSRSNSIHTVRAHIRQCHQKIGVSTREELFSRVAAVCF